MDIRVLIASFSISLHIFRDLILRMWSEWLKIFKEYVLSWFPIDDIRNVITEEFLDSWHCCKEQFLRKFKMASSWHFLPLNCCKRCVDNLKCSEILVIIELQRTCNNFEYHATFTLIVHLQRAAFDNFKSNLLPWRWRYSSNIMMYSMYSSVTILT